MRTIRLLFINVIALSVVIPVFAEDAKPDPREKLETAIAEGIRLLEAKKYIAFVKGFVSPAELREITKEVPLEELVKVFGKRNAPRLLEVLKEIKDATPKLDDSGTKATFVLKKAVGGRKSITFVKVEKYWYIKN